MKCRSYTRRPLTRHGISLLEVIACTALVAVMLVPIAGMIRASGQSIQRAHHGTTSDQLRTTLKWLRETIDAGEVIGVGNRSLQLQLVDGRLARIYVQSGDLILDDGTDEVLLASDIRDILFQSIRSATPPRNRVGIDIRLRGRDASTGQIMTVNCTVAETLPF
tara:strand:- start:1072855 stop:1073346 length:492 start_codon:yes stop_codon:yes gene_type:complete